MPNPATYRILGANVRRPPAKGENYKRTPADALKMLQGLIATLNPHALILLEVAEYHDILRKIPGYDALIFTDPGHGDNAILVRSDVPHDAGASIEHGGLAWWLTVRGTKSWGRAHVTVKLPGLRLVGVHTPPSVNWVKGLPVGPALRIRVYKAMMTSLRAAIADWTKSEPDNALFIYGDWNEPPTSKGTDSPNDVAADNGLTIFPGVSIDWSMGRNVQVKTRPIKVGTEGNTSDHPLLDLTVTVPARVEPAPAPNPAPTPTPTPEAPVPSDPYGHSHFRGVLLDNATIAALQAMEAELGYELTLYQGIGGAAASGGTHLKGRAVDLAPWDYKRKLRVGLKHGFIGWHRPRIKGLWQEHNHLVLVLGSVNNQRGIAPAAWRQIGYYLRRLDGLVSSRFDASTNPGALVPFVYPPKEIPVPVPSNHITAARDRATEAIKVLGDMALELEQAKRPTKAGQARVVAMAAAVRGTQKVVSGYRASLPKS